MCVIKIMLREFKPKRELDLKKIAAAVLILVLLIIGIFFVYKRMTAYVVPANFSEELILAANKINYPQDWLLTKVDSYTTLSKDSIGIAVITSQVENKTLDEIASDRLNQLNQTGYITT